MSDNNYPKPLPVKYFSGYIRGRSSTRGNFSALDDEQHQIHHLVHGNKLDDEGATPSIKRKVIDYVNNDISDKITKNHVQVLEKFGEYANTEQANSIFDKMSNIPDDKTYDTKSGKHEIVTNLHEISPDRFHNYISNISQPDLHPHYKEKFLKKSGHPLIALDVFNKDKTYANINDNYKAAAQNINVSEAGKLDDSYKLLQDWGKHLKIDADNFHETEEARSSILQNSKLLFLNQDIKSHIEYLRTIHRHKTQEHYEMEHIDRAVFDPNMEADYHPDYIKHKQRLNDMFVNVANSFSKKLNNSSKLTGAGAAVVELQGIKNNFIDTIKPEENFNHYHKLFTPEQHLNYGNDILAGREYGGLRHMKPEEFFKTLPKNYQDISKENHHYYITNVLGKDKIETGDFSKEESKSLLKNRYFTQPMSKNIVRNFKNINENDLIDIMRGSNHNVGYTLSNHPEFKTNALLESSKNPDFHRLFGHDTINNMIKDGKEDDILANKHTTKLLLDYRPYEMSEDLKNKLINHPIKSLAASFLTSKHKRTGDWENGFHTIHQKVKEHLLDGHNDLAYHLTGDEDDYIPNEIKDTIFHYSIHRTNTNTDPDAFIQDSDKHLIHQNLLGHGKEMFNKIMNHPNVDERVKEYGRKYYLDKYNKSE